MTWLRAIFTGGGVLRAGWVVAGFLAILGAASASGYWLGHSHASSSCEAERNESRAQAADKASRATSQIADIRVAEQRERARISEEFDHVEDEFNTRAALQADLVAGGCELDPLLLRILNDAILRTGGTDPDPGAG